MRRLLRTLFTLAAVVSTALCGACGALWVRNYRHPGQDEASVRRGAARYAVRSEAGRLNVFGPPAATGNPDDRRKIEAAGAGMTNDDLTWQCLVFRGADAPNEPHAPSFERGSQAGRARAATVFGAWNTRTYAYGVKPDAVGPLLAALEDPDRFVAAHVARAGAPQIEGDWEARFVWSPKSHSGTGVYDGLRVQLVGPEQIEEPEEIRLSSAADFDITCEARIDPAQLPAIRDQWHRRLDVVAWSAPWWRLTAAAAVVPLLKCALLARRAAVGRRRRRLGLCRRCGYDLRGNPTGRCSECGAEAVPNRPAAPAGVA